MLNIERYFDDIVKINNCDFAFDIENNEVMECDCRRCQKCLFSGLNRPKEIKTCSYAKIKWLKQEYKGVK